MFALLAYDNIASKLDILQDLWFSLSKECKNNSDCEKIDAERPICAQRCSKLTDDESDLPRCKDPEHQYITRFCTCKAFGLFELFSYFLQKIVGLSINHEIPNNYLFVAMSGYDCAYENEECKCSGEVSYGIYDDSKRSHPDVVFGNWSEKKLVERSINCTEENFPDYPEKEYDKPMKNCWCYPSSKRLFYY